MHMSTVLRPLEYAFSLFFICMIIYALFHNLDSILSFASTIIETYWPPNTVAHWFLSVLKLGSGIILRLRGKALITQRTLNKLSYKQISLLLLESDIYIYVLYCISTLLYIYISKYGYIILVLCTLYLVHSLHIYINLPGTVQYLA